MSSLLVGLVSALVATNPPAVASNLVTQTTGLSVSVPNPNDPIQKELQQLMEKDDAAQAEVDEWIRENDRFRSQGAGIPDAELNRRIRKRFDPIRLGYEDLVKRCPTNADLRVAFASFLRDMGQPDEEVAQLEKARELDPKDPAIWNNLANYYGEFSPVTNAFRYYQKAIELNPAEPVYFENFATTVCMFRKDAREYYHLTEAEVFDKSLALYAKALSLSPSNFALATELAETYYIIKPMRLDAALQSWTNALSIAGSEVEREGVYIHLARLKASAGRFAEARAHLDAVTNAVYTDLKMTGLRNLERREQDARQTNSPPAELEQNPKK